MNMRSRTRNLVLISLTVALTTAGAYLRIPVGPVPISLQTLFVLLSGALLGPWVGSLAMIAYLVLGLMGLPVFTGGGGPQYILSPTFGFLLAFPLSAMVVGLVLSGDGMDRQTGFGRRIAALLLGTGVIYLVGIPWLGLHFALVQSKPMGTKTLLTVGMLPFLPGDLLKVLLVAWIIEPTKRALRQGGR